MMRQLAFAGVDLDEPPAASPPRPQRVAKKKAPLRKARPATPAEGQIEERRLGGQSLRILQRLQQGTATNVELAEISLKYTSRISNVRQAGYVVEVVGRDYKTGLTVYQLRK